MNLSLSRVMAAQADRLTLTFHVVLAASRLLNCNGVGAGTIAAASAA